VERSDWEISYYFPGPDLRYKGEFLQIHQNQIDAYIHAYQENWGEFEILVQKIPPGGDFVKDGKAGMKIRISEFRPGVCIRSYHMPINTKEGIDKIVQEYQYAKDKANYIYHVLFQ
jgi:hypothetical protein